MNCREIQALDDILGRWEPAKLKYINEDGTLSISFIGWGAEYDTVLEPSKVRQAIHPFESEVGKCLNCII